MTRVRVSDRGAAAVWVLACAALLMTFAVLTSVRSLAVLARHRAESAADLAALAAAGQIGIDETGICPAAGKAAEANRAVLRSCAAEIAPSGRSGAVRVRVSLSFELPLLGERSATATARAGRIEVPP